MDDKEIQEFRLYKDIQGRTGGEIYIGVVGPVRTGKSTFIKRFMDMCVLPFMEEGAEKERTIDELPQSAQGKMVMTTEPKFIPKKAASLALKDNSQVNVRLIDCVGFMVDGAEGFLEGQESRMVKTPWSNQEIPFEEAAKIGTQKVINDHSTIGIVVTTDGSIGDIPRDSYVEAEEKTVSELKRIGKPFVILLNCQKPNGEEARAMAERLQNKYEVCVMPVNVKQMHQEEIYEIIEKMLMEFPVIRIHFHIPKWAEMLPTDHRMKRSLLTMASNVLGRMNRMKDTREDWMALGSEGLEENFVSRVKVSDRNLCDGTVSMQFDMDDKYYYENISEMAGVEITGEYQMISLIRELSRLREEYESVRDAMEAVEQKGYGVVMPKLSEISMENPVLIQHGGKYGVKMKAISPSIHFIRANIETEIAPIVGSKEQAEDLIAYIKEGEESNEGIWTTNIFGKSVGELMEDGIRSKISKMDDECQMKLQDTMQKIVNESNGGLICLII
ncbi:MAG: stage IV sporulation protein A [Agathobacter sp.]|nr:stage IV sporulation protein A [Agathobacter sp.]